MFVFFMESCLSFGLFIFAMTLSVFGLWDWMSLMYLSPLFYFLNIYQNTERITQQRKPFFNWNGTFTRQWFVFMLLLISSSNGSTQFLWISLYAKGILEYPKLYRSMIFYLVEGKIYPLFLLRVYHLTP